MRAGSVKRPTSTDVAREAGLSRSTVSYVLNDDPRQTIPEATRQRVFDAAAKLGYTPSAAARALRSGRSDLVLCLLPDWPLGPTLGGLLEHLSAGLEQHGLTLVLHPRVHSTRPTSQLWRSITPAAVLTFDQISDLEVAAIRASGAVLSQVLHADKRTTIGDERLGRAQYEHLAATGHRHIGYAYPDDERVRYFADPRLAGVRMAAADLQLDAPDVQIVPLDPVGAEVAVRAWRRQEPRITAVCAYNDEVAMAVLAAAHRLRVKVPRDLAVIGVDDIPSAPLTLPALTTVCRDTASYAQFVTTEVVRSLEGRPPLRRWPNSDAVNLIVRASA